MSHFVTASDLPDPPFDKNGWPWTGRPSDESDTATNSASHPRISIVTPSYNQGEFIEATIRSVLLQNYPNLEYIVIDGGSSDNTVEILEQYDPWIDHWVSEPDRGQSHAINKGFERATGEIFGWLNSDDYFTPHALAAVLQCYRNHPDAVGWAGACMREDVEGNALSCVHPRVGGKEEIGDWWETARFHQPACLFSAEAFRAVGGLDEDLEYVMDVELWLKLAERGRFASHDETVAHAKYHPEMKTWRAVPERRAEMIAINVNHGLRDVAARQLQRYADYQNGLFSFMRAVFRYVAKNSLKLYWALRRLLAGGK